MWSLQPTRGILRQCGWRVGSAFPLLQVNSLPASRVQSTSHSPGDTPCMVSTSDARTRLKLMDQPPLLSFQHAGLQTNRNSYSRGGICCCTAFASGQGTSEKPPWCQKLPRPEYSKFQRIPAADTWFEVYKVAPDVSAIYEPHQFEETISYLIAWACAGSAL